MLKFALKQVTCVFPEHKGKIHHLHPGFVWENRLSLVHYYYYFSPLTKLSFLKRSLLRKGCLLNQRRVGLVEQLHPSTASLPPPPCMSHTGSPSFSFAFSHKIGVFSALGMSKLIESCVQLPDKNRDVIKFLC